MVAMNVYHMRIICVVVKTGGQIASRESGMEGKTKTKERIGKDDKTKTEVGDRDRDKFRGKCRLGNSDLDRETAR